MKLIIINGLPGTGKTTIAKPLSQKLGLPLVAKDTIKEFLFDTVGVGDREWSKMLGKVSSEFLYSLAEALLANDTSVIIESAFEARFAKSAIERLAEAYQPDVFEVYCTTNKDVRRQRFIDRNESGERHKGHVDEANYPSDSDAEPLEKYAPVGIGELIILDTSHRHIDINDLAQRLM